MLGVVIVEGAREEDRIDDCSGVLEVVCNDYLNSLGSEAQGVDGVAEALEYPVYSEDDLGLEMNEEVSHEVTGLEDHLHRCGYRGFFCGRHSYG